MYYCTCTLIKVMINTKTAESSCNAAKMTKKYYLKT